MNRLSLAARAAVALALFVLATGCATSTRESAGTSTESATTTQSATSTDNSASANDSVDNSASAADSASTSALASETASTPAVEGTGVESPQQPNNGGPTISVASLPVGGDIDSDGALQCAHVNLITNNQLPKWVSISIDSIGLSPEGIFRLGGDLCNPADPPCAGYSWTAGTAGRECAVDVTQIKDSTETVKLVLSATVHCPDQRTCDVVQNAFDASGARIEFTASTGVVPTNSGSSSQASPSLWDSSAGTPESSAASTAGTESSTAGS
jgi:hypothetical protein